MSKGPCPSNAGRSTSSPLVSSDYTPLLRPEVRAKLDARTSAPKGSKGQFSAPPGARGTTSPQPPKPLSCPKCGRGFKYPKRLESHVAGCQQ